jgi:hypothetical protein
MSSLQVKPEIVKNQQAVLETFQSVAAELSQPK